MTYTFICPYCDEKFDAVEDIDGECPNCKEKYEWDYDGNYEEDSVWTINWFRSYNQNYL
jgi:hypothetical protein